MFSFVSRFKIRTQLAVLLLIFGMLPLLAVIPIVFAKLNGMPKAAKMVGGVDREVPLSDIPQALLQLCIST